MTQVWDADNRMVPSRWVQAGPCVVTLVRTPADDGYSGVQIAYGAIDPRKVTKPLAGHFAKAGVTPRRHVVEIRTADAGSYELGQELTVETFEAGQLVDVVGRTKGKGTAGVMKRHGFSGLGSSHGTQRKHRSRVRSARAPRRSRVFKGVKMAGRMGGVRQSTQNLTPARGGRRAWPAADQGCRPRTSRRGRARAHCRQGRPDGRRREGSLRMAEVASRRRLQPTRRPAAARSTS
jgi:large subunit ribosomal protein L3